jgi:hypothetical protein
VTRLAGGTDPVIAWLRRLGPGVRAVYEPDPTGFGLARAARDAGIDLRVTTPGLVPKRRRIGSRPTGVTRSAWRGCWPRANCPSRGSRRLPRRRFVI